MARNIYIYIYIYIMYICKQLLADNPSHRTRRLAEDHWKTKKTSPEVLIGLDLPQLERSSCPLGCCKPPRSRKCSGATSFWFNGKTIEVPSRSAPEEWPPCFWFPLKTDPLKGYHSFKKDKGNHTHASHVHKVRNESLV